MLTLLVLLSSEAWAVPLDLCVNRGSGSLAGLGGQYLWEINGTTDVEQALAWSTLCGVGGTGAPRPTILQPTAGTVVNPGGLAELVVSANSGDPDRGWGRCEWWVERDGQRSPLPVRLPGGTTSRTSLPWSRTNPVCAGVASLAGLQPGTYALWLRASDLYGKYGEATQDIRVNEVPHVTLAEPADDSVYLTGDTFTATALVGDDTPAGVGSVVTFVVSGAEGSTTTPCVITAAGSCTTTLAAPDVAGAFEIRASYTDVDATTGQVFSTRFYANDVPGVVITSPADGEMIEPSVPTDILVQVTDATASPGDLVDVTFADDRSAWTSTCALDGALSCVVSFEPGSVGEYTLSASYTDAYGEVGVSPEVTVLANDTPVLAVDGLEDGLVVEPGPLDGIAVDVADDDPSSGVLTAQVSDSAGSHTVALGAPAADGSATISLDFLDIDTYTVSLTFTDEWGAATSTAPVVVTTNYAPTLTLSSPASGARVTVPSNDPLYEIYHYSFFAWDDDDSALTVQPAEGLDAYTACTCDASGMGPWECDLDLSTWALGVHTITVVAADDVEETTDSFELELLADTDYDYDGDGVLESDWLTYGDGYGDCAPDDPTAHGADPDAGIAAAPELCDTVDNDCDGEVNNGLPDPEGGDTIADAHSITGTTVTLGSGDSIEDEGSLYSDGDVDWWYVQLAEDTGRARNAGFFVTLVVPQGADGSAAGAWALGTWVGTSASASPTLRTPPPPAMDCSSSPGECTITWSVTGYESVDDEKYWRLVVSASDWNPAMCSETTSPTYRIIVSN